jgi:uncharacterized protein (TIRG00374 family)
VKHWGKALFGIVVTILALWWALSDVESFSELWANIRLGNDWLLIAAVAVATFGFVFRAMRWNVLLSRVKNDTSLRSRFGAVSIGFMANNILPARVGEFARAFALSRMEPITASAAFGTLVVERFMDGVVLLLFLVLPIFTPGFPSEVLQSGAGAVVLRGAVALVVMVLLALVVMAAWPKLFVRVAHATARFLPKAVAGPVLSGIDAFLDSIAIIRDPKVLAVGFAWTLFFWTWHAASFWLGMMAFGIDTGFVSAIFTSSVVGFGVAVPAAPGFFGTFHASAAVALSDVYGVSPAQSLAFAFGYHFGGWVPITLIGLWFAWRIGFTLRDVGSAEDQMGQKAEGSAQPEGERAGSGKA